MDKTHWLIQWIFWKRFHLSLMIFWGLFNTYTLRNSLTVAIVKMREEKVVPPYIWGYSSEIVILTSFFPLYIICNFFGGSIAERLGSKMTFGVGVLLTSLVTLFIPLAARHNYITLIFVRVLQGIFEGLSIPVAYTIYGKWFPKSERTFLRSFCECGFDAGILVGNTITGYLCADKTFGWQSVFYLFAGFSVLWSIVWFLFIYETPAEHPHISEKERNFILADQGEEYARNKVAAPWRLILKNVSVWAMAVGTVISGFFIMFIRQEYPSYLKAVYHYEVQDIGWISMLPQAVSIVAGISSSILADFIMNRTSPKHRTFIRKVFNVASTIPTAAAQLTIIFLGNNPEVVKWMMTIAYGLNSIDNAGSAAIPIDMSPVFAGSIYGFLNALGNVSAVTAPVLIGLITQNHESERSRWNILFYISFATNVFSTLLFVVFVKSDLQPWGLGVESLGQSNSNVWTFPSIRRASYELQPVTSETLVSHETFTTNHPIDSRKGVQILQDDLKKRHSSSPKLSTCD